MAKTTIVTTTTLKSKANELKSLNSNFKKQVSALREQEKSLNSMWDGEANTAFHNAFEKDATQMDNFYNAIEKYYFCDIINSINYSLSSSLTDALFLPLTREVDFA